MYSAWVVVAALVFGGFLGCIATIFVRYSRNLASSALAIVTPQLPDGVDQILHTLDGAGIVVDPSGNIVKATGHAEDMGLVAHDRLAHAELDQLAIAVRESGRVIERELEITRGALDEAHRPIVVRAAPLGTRFIVLMVEDRTDALRVENMRRDFIANISHELKTPIGAVTLLAEALDPAADDPVRVRRFAGRIGEEAARLARITGDIINLSRLQVNDPLAEPSQVDVNRIVSQAVGENKVAAEGRSITLVFGSAEDALVLGDSQTLEVAVHNLIANAIAYSPDGTRVGVGVSVSDGVVSVAVADQGIGIAVEDQERVFERFFRVDRARARATGGTGLGLAIVKHAAQNHGGSVRLWSQLGRGSTFTIRLPHAPVEVDATPRAIEGVK